MRSLLIRFYPATWRARYGAEFLAILEERPLGPFDVADILLGALDARLRSRGRGAQTQHGRGFIMSLRLGGIAAIIGASLWAVAGLLNSGLVTTVEGSIPQAIFLIGLAVLLIAFAGLSAFQARVHPRLVWTGFGLTAGGTAVAIALFVQMPIPDSLWGAFLLAGVAAFAGCFVFAVVTFQTAALPRAGAFLIGVGCIVVFLQALIAVGLASMAVGWFVLGIQAIRARPARASIPA